MGKIRGVRTVRLAAWLALSAAFTLCGPACQPTGGGDGGEPPPPQDLNCGTTLAILNLPANIQLSGQSDLPLTVLYRASGSASNIRGLYVPVSSNASNAVETGPEVIVAQNLPAGENQSFNIPLGQLSNGFYRVGIRAGSGSSEARCLAVGTIEIVESSLPEFTLPAANLEVTQGEDVQVGIDLHDPAGALQWRLFYIGPDGPFDVPPDQLGTQIRTGQGNSNIILWGTGAVPSGAYLLGLSTTDSGQTIAETVAAGNPELVRTILNPFSVTVTEPSGPGTGTSPLLDVTQPSFNQNALLGDSTIVQIAFEATIRATNAVNPSIRVFRDQDGRAGTGDEVTIEASLPADTKTATLDTEPLDEGTYFIGVTVNDGVSATVTEYAQGRVTVSTDSLEVTAPDSTNRVRPGTEVSVEWSTNITSDRATVEVFRQRLDSNNNATGSEIPILAATRSDVTTATFVASESGRFQVTVRYNFDAADKADMTDSAPQPVVVTSLPLILWTGDLAEFDPVDSREEPKGAVLEGHQFEDNAGSAFVKGEDFDSDGITDFLVGARYAKPEFINPSGIGEGEAYLIRGSSFRLRGSVNLNSVGSADLPGVVLTGPPSFVGGGSTTQGLSSIFVSSDADGDGKGEILFGFPFTTTFRERQGDIDADRQFENGGVVLVSSGNSLVRGGSSDTRGGRLQLQFVGLNFQSRRCQPEPDDGALCTDGSAWMADFLSPNESPTCPGAQACPAEGSCVDSFAFNAELNAWVPNGGCEPETENACWDIPDIDGFVGCLRNANAGNPTVQPDGDFDTLVEPKYGFRSHLAINFLDHYTDLFGRFPCTFPDPSPYPCPSCDSDPLNRINQLLPCDSCEEWTFDVFAGGWVPTGDTLCSFISDNYLAPWPDYSLALIPDVFLSCSDQVDLIIEPSIALGQPLVSAVVGSPMPPPVPSVIGTGFFNDRIAGGEDDDDVDWNDPLEPFGCRFIGRPVDSLHEEPSAFGTSIAQSGRELIITAPARDAVNGLDISGLSASENEDAGIAYLFSNEDLWGLPLTDGIPGGGVAIPPKPHIYSAGGGGHTGFVITAGSIPPTSSCSRQDVTIRRVANNSSGTDLFQQGGLKIAGRAGEHIENVIGIPDFNRDSRPDFALGSPRISNGDGALYVAFRRPTALEGDYALEKLTLATNNPERLAGVYVTAQPGSAAQLGASLAGGIDFNSNGVADVAVGAPNGNGGTGEVVIVFASNQLTSPQNGVSVQTLLNQRQAARITGLTAGSGFGFNVANAGDIDGDGTDDLLIAAPDATPMFDSTPNDATDELNTKGLDRDLNGVKDDVTGPRGIPDGVVDTLDNLEKSGLIYVVFGSSDARKWATTATGPYTISISKLGSAQLPGFIVAGRRAGDLLGGGDATTANPNKTFGRSQGLAGVGDVDGDGHDDFMVGSILADPRVDPQSGVGTVNGGEAYLIYGFEQAQ